MLSKGQVIVNAAVLRLSQVLPDKILVCRAKHSSDAVVIYLLLMDVIVHLGLSYGTPYSKIHLLLGSYSTILLEK